MPNSSSAELLDDFRRNLSSADSPVVIPEIVTKAVLELMPFDRCRCTLLNSNEIVEFKAGDLPYPVDIGGPRIENGQVKIGSLVLPLPLFVSDIRRCRVDPELMRYLQLSGAKSFFAVALYHRGFLCGWIEGHFCNSLHYWNKDESRLLQELAEFASNTVSQRIQYNSEVKKEKESLEYELALLRKQHSEMIEHGGVILVRTNTKLQMISVVGDTHKILGVEPESLLNSVDIWKQLLHPLDLRQFSRQMHRMRESRSELNGEFRVINQETGATFWIMLKARPLFDNGHRFLGWDGFGVDITEQQGARDKLALQERRIEALYEVSRALQVNVDPALVTLRGLRALIRATRSDSGFVCFYDKEQDHLELVSSEGLSTQYVEDVSKVLNGPSLARTVINTREGLLIGDVQRDSRAAIDLAKAEGVRSAIVMPVQVKEEAQGILVLFCKEANVYSAGDFELVAAAAAQICMAVRQAETYLSEKRQVNALAALYRLSHELSKQLTPRKVAETAFPILQSEMSCKRLWLGVLNDQGTHILGQAGHGPGVRARLIDLQIDLTETHEFLDEALRKKQPIIVKQGQTFDCSRLTRIVQRMNLGMFVIVPLVSLGQVVGVMIVEPSYSSSFLLQRKIPILTSMASEIATVLLSRRFESKMADAEKMRVAGLLASGVAHNFNNMLQAVMGQASLIEMQLPKDSPLFSSSRVIIEAANRGAGLIKQLLSFSMPGSPAKAHISVSAILQESQELYRSVLGSNINLELKLNKDLPFVLGDQGKLQHVITNLLVNAKDALAGKQDGLVKITTSEVSVGPGEIDPDLVPGNYLRLDVADNGAGMDPERQSRCFEPFFTTKNVDTRTGISFNGSGLGLSSAYSILKGHDGAITVSSAPGEGSVFSIYLPTLERNANSSALVEEVKELDSLSLEGLRTAWVIVGKNDERDALTPLLESHSFSVVIRTELAGLLDEEVLSKSGSGLVLFDLDECSDSAVDTLQKLESVNGNLKYFCLCADLEHWSTILGAHNNVFVIERPMGVWALEAALRRAFPGIKRDIISESVDSSRNGKEHPRLHLVERRGPQLVGERK